MRVTINKKNSAGIVYATATRIVKSLREFQEFCDKVGYYQSTDDGEFDFKTGADVIYTVPYNWVVERGH